MKALVPELKVIPDRKMLVVKSIGDPQKVASEVFEALFGTAYATRFKVYKPQGLAVKFGKLSGIWTDAHLKPRDEWHGIWGLPVPDFYEDKDLIQKNPDIPAHIEVWPGGTFAQVLHLGAYKDEEPTVKLLHSYIENEQGIAMKDVPGQHEEEYLTSPDAKVVKTIIRYRIK